MCLIIAPGKDGQPALLPREVFDYTYQRNKDGFGAMWVQDGRVEHFKTLGLTADQIYEKMEQQVADHPETIFHMRLKTHGKIIPGLSHPFRILNKNRHGKDLFFMHNGVLSSFGNNLTYGQSDTTKFKDKILIPLLTRDPDALDDPAVWEQINKMTSGSRLIFLDSNGKSYITSPSSWNHRYDLTLSNTYMLPDENPYSHGYYNPMSANDDEGGTSVPTVTGHFVYFRQIDRLGDVKGHWCSCPKTGYIRTESGLLYKDNGPKKKIYHAANFIPKENEYKHLGLQIVKPESYPEDTGSEVMDEPFTDDDLPFELVTPVSRGTRTGPDPKDNQLRYARLVNNMYAGAVTSRPHMVADFLGMGDTELYSFIKEDPETASVAFAELLEMILEYNNELWNVEPNCEILLKPDELVRLGTTEYHRDAIQEVAKIRRAEYEEQLKALFEKGDEEDEQGVQVN